MTVAGNEVKPQSSDGTQIVTAGPLSAVDLRKLDA